jgi:hypothetical protein
MANSAFLPFIIGIHFHLILQNLRKIKGSFDHFQSKRNRNPKASNFFELTDYKQIFLKSEIELYKNSHKLSKF